MMGRRVGGGALTGGAGSDDARMVFAMGVGVTAGSLRTEDATSGRGANSATSASISRRLRPPALAKTAV